LNHIPDAILAPSSLPAFPTLYRIGRPWSPVFLHFFQPNFLAHRGMEFPIGSDHAAYYSTMPLEKTLLELVDFERINSQGGGFLGLHPPIVPPDRLKLSRPKKKYWRVSRCDDPSVRESWPCSARSIRIDDNEVLS
jgi:hypothetical protein